ncbi:MAG: hypothetical protein ACP5IO_00370 [Elusimicrobiales bacterium]
MIKIALVAIILQSSLFSQQPSTLITQNLGNDESELKKTPVSGLVITPTAYRTYGLNEIGSSLDINAAYYIGRLYGKNTFNWTVDKKNYLDKIGLWYLEMDGKLLIQKERKYIPAFASGAKASFLFRDSPQPNLSSPSASFKVDSKNTQDNLSLYFVISKYITKNYVLSAGYSEGDFSKTVYMLSEFLSERSSDLTYSKPRRITHSTLFFNTFLIIKDKNIIGFEVIIPQGSTFSPKLINLQLANFLKLNFQLSYLTYKAGNEILGMFNFRYPFYPRIKKS